MSPWNHGQLGGYNGFHGRPVAPTPAGSSSVDHHAAAAPRNDNFESEPPPLPIGHPDLIAVGAHTTGIAAQGSEHAVSHQVAGSLSPLPAAVVAPSTNVDRSFQCELCPKIFTTRDSLVRHETTVHNSDTCPKYLCPEPNCQRPFTRADSLIRHQTIFFHFGVSPPWTVYSQRHELSGNSSNNHVQDLEQLMQPGQGPVPLHLQPLPDQREYLRGVQHAVRSRCNDIQSLMHQLSMELRQNMQADHDAAKRLCEIDEIEAREFHRGITHHRLAFH